MVLSRRHYFHELALRVVVAQVAMGPLEPMPVMVLFPFNLFPVCGFCFMDCGFVVIDFVVFVFDQSWRKYSKKFMFCQVGSKRPLLNNRGG